MPERRGNLKRKGPVGKPSGPFAFFGGCYPAGMTVFDVTCTLCPRLAEFLAQGRELYPTYHCRPVPPFGDAEARLLLVGLAPGFHGANATGRPFTGDYAG